MAQLSVNRSNSCGLSQYERIVKQYFPDSTPSQDVRTHVPGTPRDAAVPLAHPQPLPSQQWAFRNHEMQDPGEGPAISPASNGPAKVPLIVLPDHSRSNADGSVSYSGFEIEPDRPSSRLYAYGRPEEKRADRGELRVTNEVNDDYSEAGESGLEDHYRDHSRPASRQLRGNMGIDSDGSDGGSMGLNDYDSDLESVVSDPAKLHHEKKMRRWRSQAEGIFERMLLDCIVNTDSICPGYADIVIDPRTIRKLDHVTSLSLRRPKAFNHGVLKGNKVTGAILQGPPGTGKSHLVKGLAKASNFNMLSISTAEIWQKCHGEDEKVIKAVFSLARKLYPCIIFIDEADAMLGSRKAGEKRHIRAMLNQSLMEWDGLLNGVTSPFVLLASNWPTDLDPAIARRAPIHIHLDIPTDKERGGILNLLLKDECLAPNINTS